MRFRAPIGPKRCENAPVRMISSARAPPAVIRTAVPRKAAEFSEREGARFRRHAADEAMRFRATSSTRMGIVTPPSPPPAAITLPGVSSVKSSDFDFPHQNHRRFVQDFRQRRRNVDFGTSIDFYRLGSEITGRGAESTDRKSRPVARPEVSDRPRVQAGSDHI